MTRNDLIMTFIEQAKRDSVKMHAHELRPGDVVRLAIVPIDACALGITHSNLMHVDVDGTCVLTNDRTMSLDAFATQHPHEVFYVRRSN